MCGIAGYAGEKDTSEVLHEMMKRMEYRGYDSWGVATEKGIEKSVGQVPDKPASLNGELGIGHTRWGSHGAATIDNAHPHESCDNRFAIIHNGIIENYNELKEGRNQSNNLKSHKFTSDTDSEIVAHFLEEYVEVGGADVRAVLQQFHDRAEGTYAIVVLDREEEKLYALKNKSPLLLAVDDTGHYFSSDVYAVSKWSNQADFMEDGEIIETDGSKAWCWKEGKRKSPNYEDFEWTVDEAELENHDHWMSKEINETPFRLKNLHEKIYASNRDYSVYSEEFASFADKIKNAERVIFTASGTSYHATLLGSHYLQKVGIEAQTLIASEFENYERVTGDTVVVAVSQSGETRDVLDVVEQAQEKGAEVISLTNTPMSTLERQTSNTFRIQAKQEICVAATKTFVNQVGFMMALAEYVGGRDEVQFDGLINPLKKTVMDERWNGMETAGIINGKLKNRKDDFYIIGSGVTYPIAREIALKLKEISYIHAEGMMAGEFKHGTLALIEDDTPVLALNDGNIDSNISEVESRGAHIIEKSRNDNIHEVNKWESEEAYVMRSVIFGFWLTYYLAKFRGLPIDRPRNLSKTLSVS